MKRLRTILAWPFYLLAACCAMLEVMFGWVADTIAGEERG
jgi:hypothetical protein